MVLSPEDFSGIFRLNSEGTVPMYKLRWYNGFGRSKYRVIRNDCLGFNNLPPRSPDATPYDFFLWGCDKDQVYIPPLPASILELKVRIRTANETITGDMLQTVWNKLDYYVYVCRITKSAHIEHL